MDGRRPSPRYLRLQPNQISAPTGAQKPPMMTWIEATPMAREPSRSVADMCFDDGVTSEAARQAVIDHICRPSLPPVAVEGGTRGWQKIVGGRPWEADPASITFLREHGSQERWVFVVSFVDREGTSHLYTVGVRRALDGTWPVGGMSGGTDGHIERDRPWLNLAGQAGPDGLFMGGRLVGKGAERAHAAVLLEGRTEVTDIITADVALFVSDEPIDLSSAVVRILDSDGVVLAEQPVV